MLITLVIIIVPLNTSEKSFILPLETVSTVFTWWEVSVKTDVKASASQNEMQIVLKQTGRKGC